MGSALDEFRAQRKAAEALQARVVEIAELLRAIRRDAEAVAHHDGLRALIREEQNLVLRAQDLLGHVRQFREAETLRFWPAVWRRWAIAVALVLAAALAAGAGYVWTGRPYEAELARLRARTELGDTVTRRVLEMTDRERRQFDTLMWGTATTR